ncbi:glycoside hydrolase family 95 protein [Paenibacillus endoradicis]|uniref:glycoside hydrolase family 95 protein n=1 Tax=Paenibacillus endoradicis TaxID=2972487 RepID=UPI002158E46F|nr:glycoside hydrolase family 95 protein [Paenibacillus endoradicis]MCR8655852.1 glycoside hydrolase family 95 protein [Paenibacillus endoradicis]MCR8658178.1 glycoside hydrolase family 95 protein [Paenibacillus endoradicis]
MTTNASGTKLYYALPASEWEEALPIGNGRIGVMVFGNVNKDRYQLNEDTLWSGFPRDTNNYEALRHLKTSRDLLQQGKYADAEVLIENKMLAVNCQAYQPFGDLYIEWLNAPSNVSQYERSLELSTAVATTVAVDGDNSYIREAWVSSTDDILFITYRSQGRTNLSLKASFVLPHPSNVLIEDERYIVNSKCPTHIADNYFEDHPFAVQYEEGNGVIFQSQLQAFSNGEIFVDESGVSVNNATDIVFVISIATSFNGFDKQPHHDYDALSLTNKAKLAAVTELKYDQLLHAHITEHKRLFERVQFHLEENEPMHHMPTDQRLERYKLGEQDLALESLYFHYGRYLLITSSRPGTQPANLQGIWNHRVQPPWNSDYTTNINTQMNYWPAESTSLSECHEPLLQMVEELTVTGARTARVHYNADGWVTHHNVDIWRMSSPTAGHPSWAFWPMGGVWLTQHLWERYLFHPDQTYLAKRAYPVMKGAAQFCLDWLIEDEQGQLKVSPSTSPENKFIYGDNKVSSVAENSAMDITLVTELFQHVIEAAHILNIDQDFRAKVVQALAKMPKLTINEAGHIQEWSTNFTEQEPGHRHVSHLYGLHPGTSINTSELIEAAKQSLASRISHGGGHTGWSCAWLINLYARLRMPEECYSFVRTLLTKSTYPNLFDAHPPFQIDGNFGGIAGMVEALVQSHAGVIELLPSLPKVWATGEINGLTARGGFKVSLKWADGQLRAASIESLYGQPLRVAYNQAIIIMDEVTNQTYAANQLISTNIGSRYTVHIS